MELKQCKHMHFLEDFTATSPGSPWYTQRGKPAIMPNRKRAETIRLFQDEGARLFEHVHGADHSSGLAQVARQDEETSKSVFPCEFGSWRQTAILLLLAACLAIPPNVAFWILWIDGREQCVRLGSSKEAIMRSSPTIGEFCCTLLISSCLAKLTAA
jgi:hypothetical protein